MSENVNFNVMALLFFIKLNKFAICSVLKLMRKVCLNEPFSDVAYVP